MVTITKELEATLYLAVHEAKQRRHEYLTVEHVLLAMLNDPVAKKVLVACGANLKQLKGDLEQFFLENVEPLPEGVERDPVQTPTFQRVLERAAMQVESAGKHTIDAGHLLVAFFREPSSHAVYLLEKQSVSRLDVIAYISHGTTKTSEDGEVVGRDPDEEPGYEREEDGEGQGSKKNASKPSPPTSISAPKRARSTR